MTRDRPKLGASKWSTVASPQAAPACQVEVRYICTVLRAMRPNRCSPRRCLGFETVQASMNAKDDTWVGINFVRPEDGLISMRDYTLQMKMVGYLHSVYPNVHITLHAGELAPGLVPPMDCASISARQSSWATPSVSATAWTWMYEDDPKGLLKELAKKHVMIEINLTSNDVILGIDGAAHPFPAYSRGKRAGGAFDRRRGREPHRSH